MINKWKNKSEFWIAGAKLADTVTRTLKAGSIHIKRGRIEEIVWKKSVDTDLPVFDAEGYLVTPGFIDIHSHLREPGYEESETVATGTAAAAAGGYTSVVCMANTDPAVDDPSVVRYLMDKNKAAGQCRLYVTGAVTKGLEGRDISEFHLLKEAGIVALSDDGKFVENAKVMRSALEYARMLELPIVSHCEDPSLARGGLMNEGYYSTKLGLSGIPAESEEIAVARDISLAELTGCRLHIAHVSTSGSVQLIKDAKKKGVPVTAEVTPHHLTMDDSMLEDYDRNLKVNPPLRTQQDIKALKKALKNGTIDCIATDHAPHNEISKQVEFNFAPPGMIGLQTAFSHLYTELVMSGDLELIDLVRLMTSAPAEVLGLAGGTLNSTEPADLTVIDIDEEWTFNGEVNKSKSMNTPLADRKFKGRVKGIFLAGKWKRTG
ncbi:MAG: dihydroorotase [Candidatus Krumholzibacteriota bacterium]|nr:dihydroorotase [Candidatus Krumholzibacteriota bacterium]